MKKFMMLVLGLVVFGAVRAVEDARDLCIQLESLQQRNDEVKEMFEMMYVACELQDASTKNVTSVYVNRDSQSLDTEYGSLSGINLIHGVNAKTRFKEWAKNESELILKEVSQMIAIYKQKQQEK